MSSNAFQIMKSISLIASPLKDDSFGLNVANLVFAIIGCSADVVQLVLAGFVYSPLASQNLNTKDLFLGIWITAILLFVIDIVVSGFVLKWFRTNAIELRKHLPKLELSAATLILPTLCYAFLGIGSAVAAASSRSNTTYVLNGVTYRIRVTPVYNSREAFAFQYLTVLQCCFILVPSYFMIYHTSRRAVQCNILMSFGGLAIVYRLKGDGESGFKWHNAIRIVLHVIAAVTCGVSLLEIYSYCSSATTSSSQTSIQCSSVELYILYIIAVLAAIANFIYLAIMLFLSFIACLLILTFLVCCCSINDETYTYKDGVLYKVVTTVYYY